MATTTIYATQVSAGGYTHTHVHGYRPISRPPTPVSPTLVNPPPRYTQRPSIKLSVSSAGTDILNAVVTDETGKLLYSTSSNSKRTKLLSCGNSNNNNSSSSSNKAEVATVEWDRSSPRIMFRGKKMKCKEWLPLAGSETEARTLTHGDAQFTWMQNSTSGYMIPADRPGLAVAKWRIKSRTDQLRLEIFQEALVEPGLLEAIILSIVLLRSGRTLGDTSEGIPFSSPRFYSMSGIMQTR
ncbi:hypothetical protein B0F90DRAFT_1760202 [Multifurca ochricompacta]|uniref:DUF6593 domain-containing protein n=1 Tax=Multifurca ochricompacta TaxID=376703 RepID=A0AAD4LZA8_9AGAM|nr:hypothetical protein B0F90DRAFT_1760202 [Multifurca ochricompacta]